MRTIAFESWYPCQRPENQLFLSFRLLPMPDKPSWTAMLEKAIAQLEALPCPDVDSQLLAELLDLRRRRAQQILRPLVSRTVGRSGLASKEAVIRHLRLLVSGDVAEAEKQRRKRFYAQLVQARAATQQPKILVEAPVTVVNQQLENLPAGVSLAPGRIVLEAFETIEEAQQKILALIMAMGNDPEGFAERVTVRH